MEQGIKWVAVLLLALSGFSAFADWTFGAFDAYGNDVTIKNESGQTLYGTCLDAEAHKIRVIKNKIGNVETLDLSERVVDKNGVEWRITVIKDWGFEDLTSLREVILPNSLEEIGKEAFKGCTGLTTVKPFFPSTLTNVKARAFYNCSLEGTLKLSSKSPSIIGSSAFAGESQRFRLVDLSEGNVVRIADKAFQNHTNLQAAVLSSGLLAIGESTFSGCQQLGNVVLSPVLRTIGAMAFSGCRQLTHVEPFLPDTLTSLGYRSFLDCPVAGDLSLKCPGFRLSEIRLLVVRTIRQLVQSLLLTCREVVLPASIRGRFRLRATSSGFVSRLVSQALGQMPSPDVRKSFRSISRMTSAFHRSNLRIRLCPRHRTHGRSGCISRKIPRHGDSISPSMARRCRKRRDVLSGKSSLMSVVVRLGSSTIRPARVIRNISFRGIHSRRALL